MEDPDRDFMGRVSKGDFSSLSDAEYFTRLADAEHQSLLWDGQPQRTAGEILLTALSRTEIPESSMETIVELLAESAAHSDFRPGQRNSTPEDTDSSFEDDVPDLDDILDGYVCECDDLFDDLDDDLFMDSDEEAADDSDEEAADSEDRPEDDQDLSSAKEHIADMLRFLLSDGPDGPASSPDSASLSPHAIYDLLERVHGQEEAKKAASMILYNLLEGRRSNTIFCGPTGCGKTEIWRCMAKSYPDIIRVVDASRLNADGWKGGIHLRDIFEDLPEERRNRGLIVVLDEADKLCCESAVGSGGTDYNVLVQNSLLKVSNPTAKAGGLR